MNKKVNNLIKAGVLASMVGLSPAAGYAGQPSMTAIKNFTFIHSAWMGSWQWGAVGKGLEEANAGYIAPDLPGHGQDKTPASEITLEDYVRRITDELDKLTEPTILVGHSFGGVVASQVAEARPEKVRALVYLCAFMLPNGASFLDATSGVETSDVLNNLVFSDDKFTVSVANDAAHGAVAHDVPAEAFAAAAPNFVPEPTAPLGARLSLTDDKYGAIPKYYVECTADRAIPVAIQRAMHGNGAQVEHVYQIGASHVPMFSQPQKVTEILLDIAGREYVRAATLNASRAWQDAFNNADAKAAAELYEKDATMVAQPFGTFKGREEITKFWEDLIAKGASEIEYIDPVLQVLDATSANIRSDWKMNIAKGVITKEHWVLQSDGTMLLREDHFEAKND